MKLQNFFVIFLIIIYYICTALKQQPKLTERAALQLKPARKNRNHNKKQFLKNHLKKAI